MPESPAPRAHQTGNTIRATQDINAARSARWMAGSPGWTTLEIAGELAGEVGELANICKKLRRSEMGVPGNKVSDDELLEQARGEIADVFIVLMLTASKLGIDLEDAVRETFNRKSEQMGFPERIPACTRDAALRDDAENWRAFETLLAVPGVSWSVSHPRQITDLFNVGFSFPMTREQVLDAVYRGGLGFAPTLEVMLRNAAAALNTVATPEPRAR